MPAMPRDTAPAASITTPSSPWMLKRCSIVSGAGSAFHGERDMIRVRRLAQPARVPSRPLTPSARTTTSAMIVPPARSVRTPITLPGVLDQFGDGRLGQRMAPCSCAFLENQRSNCERMIV